MHLTVVSACN